MTARPAKLLPSAVVAAAYVAFAAAAASAAPVAPARCAPHAEDASMARAGQQVLRSRVHFALSLLAGASGDRPVNAAVSPFGVSRVLAALDLGAGDAMKSSIAATLQLDGPGLADMSAAERTLAATFSGDDAPLTSTDALFADRSLNLASGVERKIAAAAPLLFERLDFASPQARARINGLIAKKTRGRITSILGPGLPPALVAVNAFSFKDCWQVKFNSANTRPQPFHRFDGTSVERAMMRRDDVRLAYASQGHLQAVELPYADARFALRLVTSDTPSSLKDLAQSTDLAELLGATELSPTSVDLTLPKFTGTGDYDLLNTLADMGLKPGLAASAQFPGFGDGVKLSAIRQKTFVAVDETGTEAAAVTIGVVTATAARPAQPIAVSFDKPFVYALEHRATGTILMIGYVADPGGKI
ncbi:MAG: serpin family protein [Ancalomicrobiaceae bacterium]|nr:serpin family protein [Ancalomicrobiaceae bacterium]